MKNIIITHSSDKTASIQLHQEALDLYNGDVQSALEAYVPHEIDEFIEITDEQLNEARQFPVSDWKIVNGEFVVEPNLDRMKADALEALDVEFSRRVVELTGNKPSEEREMWMLINLNAQKFQAGDESKRDFLEGQIPPMKKAELIAAGEDLAAWKANDALTVKAPITEKVVELAMGMKKTAEEAIEAAATHEELSTTLAALKAQEAQTITSFQAMLA